MKASSPISAARDPLLNIDCSRTLRCDGRRRSSAQPLAAKAAKARTTVGGRMIVG